MTFSYYTFHCNSLDSCMDTSFSSEISCFFLTVFGLTAVSCAVLCIVNRLLSETRIAKNIGKNEIRWSPASDIPLIVSDKLALLAHASWTYWSVPDRRNVERLHSRVHPQWAAADKKHHTSGIDFGSHGRCSTKNLRKVLHHITPTFQTISFWTRNQQKVSLPPHPSSPKILLLQPFAAKPSPPQKKKKSTPPIFVDWAVKNRVGDRWTGGGLGSFFQISKFQRLDKPPGRPQSFRLCLDAPYGWPDGRPAASPPLSRRNQPPTGHTWSDLKQRCEIKNVLKKYASQSLELRFNW